MRSGSSAGLVGFVLLRGGIRQDRQPLCVDFLPYIGQGRTPTRQRLGITRIPTHEASNQDASSPGLAWLKSDGHDSCRGKLDRYAVVHRRGHQNPGCRRSRRPYGPPMGHINPGWGRAWTRRIDRVLLQRCVVRRPKASPWISIAEKQVGGNEKRTKKGWAKNGASRDFKVDSKPRII